MSSLRTRWFFFRKKYSLMRRLARRVRGADPAAKLHNQGSKAIYDNYGERELRDYESGLCRALDHGQLRKMPYTEVRAAYVAPVLKAIRQAGEQLTRPARVLEVGCGNGTNLMLIRKALGDSVELSGIDISANRIEVGRRYWGELLSGVDLRQADATDLSALADDSFDVVYSICALEQITYRIHEVVSEMRRLARQSIVCVEPIYEYGNDAQRLYNIVNDQCRTLLSDIRSTDLQVEEHGLMPVLHNPLNPVGLVVSRKAA